MDLNNVFPYYPVTSDTNREHLPTNRSYSQKASAGLPDSRDRDGLIGSGVDDDVLYPSTRSSRSPSSSKAGLQKTFFKQPFF